MPNEITPENVVQRYIDREAKIERVIEMRTIQKPPATWREIAIECGYSSPQHAFTAFKRFNQSIAKVLAIGVKEKREEQLERLDRIQEVVTEQLYAFHPKVSNTGEVVRILDRATGLMHLVSDAGPIFAAAAQLVAIEKLRAELLGTKTPVKVDVTHSDLKVEIVGVDTKALT